MVNSNNLPETGSDPIADESDERRSSPTRIFLRGLAITLPPILTIVILIWLAGLVNNYIIAPTSSIVRYGFAHVIEKSRPNDELVAWEKLPPLQYCETNYVITPDLKKSLERQLREANAQPGETPTLRVKTEWLATEVEGIYVPFGKEAVPYADFYEVASHVRTSDMPTSSIGVYMELVTTRYFKSVFHLSAVAVVVAVILLYFIGRVMTVRLGQWMVHRFETRVLANVPVVSNVYSSVKQVTDFFFTERKVSYNRVVAVQYPSQGIWSIGFVTSDGMREVAEAIGEPMLSVLMPTSPMPMTGFTVTVPRSAVIDLDLTLDQAFQFCLSCGVLVPPQQRVTGETLTAQIKGHLGSEAKTPANGTDLSAADAASALASEAEERS